MAVFELFDETLDINSTENYDLAVELSESAMSFAVIDSIRNKYILLRSFISDDNRSFTLEKLSDLVRTDDFLNKTYRKRGIIVISEKSTLVPAQLYDPAMKDEYFRLNHADHENDTVMVNRLKHPDAFLLFSVPAVTMTVINSFFKGAETFHHLRTLTEAAFHQGVHPGGKGMILWVGTGFISVIMLASGNPVFINSFRYRNISDIIYFMGSVQTSCSFERETPVYLAGNIEMPDELWSSLKQYFPDLTFLKPAARSGFSYVFNDLKLHRYINLFTVNSCV
jgi:hypothetical protein